MGAEAPGQHATQWPEQVRAKGVVQEAPLRLPAAQHGSPWPPSLTGACVLPEQSYMLQDSVEHVQLFDLMRRMLEFDPAQRITLAEALLHPFFAGLTPEERSFHSSRNPSR